MNLPLIHDWFRLTNPKASIILFLHHFITHWNNLWHYIVFSCISHSISRRYFINYYIWDRILRIPACLQSLRWLCSSDPPTFTFQILRLKVSVTISDVRSTRYQNQGFLIASQVLYQWVRPSSLINTCFIITMVISITKLIFIIIRHFPHIRALSHPFLFMLV